MLNKFKNPKWIKIATTATSILFGGAIAVLLERLSRPVELEFIEDEENLESD